MLFFQNFWGNLSSSRPTIIFKIYWCNHEIKLLNKSLGEICRGCSQIVGHNPNRSPNPNLNPNLGLIHLRVKRTRVRVNFSKLGLILLCYGQMPGEILSVFCQYANQIPLWQLKTTNSLISLIVPKHNLPCENWLKLNFHK